MERRDRGSATHGTPSRHKRVSADLLGMARNSSCADMARSSLTVLDESDLAALGLDLARMAVIARWYSWELRTMEDVYAHLGDRKGSNRYATGRVGVR